jgi:hypothetical protein
MPVRQLFQQREMRRGRLIDGGMHIRPLTGSFSLRQ